MGSMLRYGWVKYINTLPLLPGANDLSAAPAELHRLLLNHTLDISMVSTIAYLRSQEHLQLLPNYGIAVGKKSNSIRLYSRYPLNALTGKCIGLTPESITSATILKILCTRYWDVTPHFKPLPTLTTYTTFDAFLLIGDQALLHPTFNGYETHDLATLWNSHTGQVLPCACFVIRKAIAKKHPEAIHAFLQKLDHNLHWSEQHRASIIEQARERTKVDQQSLAEYFNLMKYRFSTDELVGLQALADHLPYAEAHYDSVR